MSAGERAPTLPALWAALRAPGPPPPGLAAVTAAVVGGTVLLVLLLLGLGRQQHGQAAWHFYEGRAGTYYSGFLLVACAGLALAIARRRRALARFWLVAAAGFLFLAADETTLIHEGIDKWIHARLGWDADDPLTDHLDDLIVMLYGAVALGWGLRHRAALLRLRWTTLLFAIAFAGFVAMGVLDVLDLGKALEESVKVVTEAVIVAGLFAALRDPMLADSREAGVYFSGL